MVARAEAEFPASHGGKQMNCNARFSRHKRNPQERLALGKNPQNLDDKNGPLRLTYQGTLTGNPCPNLSVFAAPQSPRPGPHPEI